MTEPILCGFGLMPNTVVSDLAKIEQIGRLITGFECDTEEDAWATFRIALKQELKWCRGYKYWRRPPELFHDRRFDANQEKYIVRARITASMKPIPGAKRALLR